MDGLKKAGIGGAKCKKNNECCSGLCSSGLCTYPVSFQVAFDLDNYDDDDIDASIPSDVVVDAVELQNSDGLGGESDAVESNGSNDTAIAVGAVAAVLAVAAVAAVAAVLVTRRQLERKTSQPLEADEGLQRDTEFSFDTERKLSNTLSLDEDNIFIIDENSNEMRVASIKRANPVFTDTGEAVSRPVSIVEGGTLSTTEIA